MLLFFFFHFCIFSACLLIVLCPPFLLWPACTFIWSSYMTFVYHILVVVASRFYAAQKIMYALSFVTVLLLLLKPYCISFIALKFCLYCSACVFSYDCKLMCKSLYIRFYRHSFLIVVMKVCLYYFKGKVWRVCLLSYMYLSSCEKLLVKTHVCRNNNDCCLETIIWTMSSLYIKYRYKDYMTLYGLQELCSNSLTKM